LTGELKKELCVWGEIVLCGWLML